MSVPRRPSKPGDDARIRHMLDATCRALELAENKNVSSLQPEDETALALVRLLEILGEAASRVTPALRQRHPEVLWRDISDTRNRTIHEYFDVDMEVVGTIIRDDLPLLVDSLDDILDEMQRGTGH